MAEYFFRIARARQDKGSHQRGVEALDGGQHGVRHPPEPGLGLPAGHPQAPRGLRRPRAAEARVAEVPRRLVRQPRGEYVTVAAARDAPGLSPAAGLGVRSAAEALAVEGEHEEGREEEVVSLAHLGGSGVDDERNSCMS